MNKEKNFVSAVVYTHNAAATLKPFLQTIVQEFQTHFDHSEIIVVNDHSTDQSVQIIREISQEAVSTSISIVNMSRYHGLETAMTAGMDLAIGDFVFEFDKPVLDFNPETIMQVYERSLQGFDIVSASADEKQKLSSHMFYTLFSRFTELQSPLYTESFRILSRRVINRISSMTKTVPYRKVVYANCGLKQDNIRYKLNFSVGEALSPVDRKIKKYRVELATSSLILFTQIGYRFALGMTILMAIVALFMAIYSTAVFLIGDPVAGWTTTVLFLSVCFFGLFAILTITVKYLQIIVDLIFKKKQYSFESIEKLTK